MIFVLRDSTVYARPGDDAPTSAVVSEHGPSGCGVVGNARALGARDRRFESDHPDQFSGGSRVVMRRLFGRRPQRGPVAPPSRLEGVPPTSEEAILAVLDQGCDDFVFPMLDNGYVYLAAARLSLFRSDDDWAMAFEIFGFSPRAGEPDVSVWTFGSRIAGRKGRADYASQKAYDAYLAAHAHDDAEFFHPI